MKYIKKFNTNQQYNNYVLSENFIIPNISDIDENDGPIKFNDDAAYIDLMYEVNDTSYALTILHYGPLYESLENIENIIIDNDIVLTPTYEYHSSINYQFNTTGLHNIKIKIKKISGSYILDEIFVGIPNIKRILISNIITVNQNSVNSVFSVLSGCTYIKLPNTITSLKNNQFGGCTALTSIVIPNSVTTIGNVVFAGCTALTSVVIPNSVTTIGDAVFAGCTSLTSVVIPNSVTTIGNGAFAGCTSLTSVVIPNSVTTIGNGAFNGCTSLTSVVIPNSVTTIDSDTFNGCYSLTSVVIPNSVTTIGSTAFNGCTALTSIVIPNSVTTIGDYAFRNCHLTSIIIPSSVTFIGKGAFYQCTLMTSATINAINPPIMSLDIDEEYNIEWASQFSYGVNLPGSNYPIYVPVQALQSYKNDNYFITSNEELIHDEIFDDRFQAIPSE